MLSETKILGLIQHLFAKKMDGVLKKITPIQNSASDRKYYRITNEKGLTYIATYNPNREENEIFFKLTSLFAKEKIPCPKILYIHKDQYFYFQKDAGASNLLDKVLEEGHKKEVRNLYLQAIDQLAYLQTVVHRKINYNTYLHKKDFDYTWIWSDLFSFKCYFLDRLSIRYDSIKLIHDFQEILTYFYEKTEAFSAFLYRDFQARNILVNAENEITFIDYQGAIPGFLGYDVASLLYQARADLPTHWKKLLLDYYIKQIEMYGETKIDRKKFSVLMGYNILIRHLQVLGAYGNKGLIGNKPHFVQSILPALYSLKKVVAEYAFILNKLPELNKVITELVAPKTLQMLSKQWGIYPLQADRLQVVVQSFAYKNGLPKDYSGNGGGFVWDCRFIENPGRQVKYKALTGKDRSVQNFLEKKTNIVPFLKRIESIADSVVTTYLKRNFTHLVFAFGCTGGQHRSVYAAEYLYKYLQKKYKNKIELSVTHREQAF